VLVLTPDLEQVKEVGGRRVDGDEVFAGFGDGRGEVEDFEVFRSLVVLVSDRCNNRKAIYLDIFLDLYALHCGDCSCAERG
jgi:hypothetical protein